MFIHLNNDHETRLHQLAEAKGMKPSEVLRALIDENFIKLLKREAAKVNGIVTDTRTLPLFPDLVA